MSKQSWHFVMALCLALAGGVAASHVSAAGPSPGTSVYDRKRLDTLYDRLARSQSPARAQQIEKKIWQLWTEGPDDKAGKQIERIMTARLYRDYEKALEIATKLTERLPDYAEAWNQKATVLFEMGRYDRSLDVVEKVLELEPKHFGALAGKGRMLMRQGRVKLGQQAIRRAVEIHPYVQARSLLVEPPDQRI